MKRIILGLSLLGTFGFGSAAAEGFTEQELDQFSTHLLTVEADHLAYHCTDQLTEVQKIQLRDLKLRFKKATAMPEASLKVSLIDYLLNLANTDGDSRDVAQTIANTSLKPASQRLIAKWDFIHGIFFDVLVPDQRWPMMRCIAKYHHHHHHTKCHDKKDKKKKLDPENAE